MSQSQPSPQPRSVKLASKRHAVAILLCLCSPASARDYYLTNSGDDAGPGTSEHPWATIARANKADLKPGDRLLLAAGQAFAGPLLLTARTQGSPGNNVVITSYGSGRAIIDGDKGPAISLDGSHHVAIRSLRLKGSGRKTRNDSSGLILARGRHLEVDDIEVFGFRSSGIAIDGVEDCRITRVHAHENGFAGISSDGATSRNLYIGHSLTENNPGDPAVLDNHSGNGIVVGHARDALVEYCEARYNGWDMPWTDNGPVGIWTYESDRVTIQHCISHHNRSTALDGGGFDFDGGVTNSILQFNYSHDNFGSGYLICQYDGAGTFEGNTVRYNISQDDGLKDHSSGIYVWVGGPGMKSTAVYNNTIFNSKGSAVAFGVHNKYKGPLPDFRFFNNIFISLGPQIRGGAGNGTFKGNLYWSVGGRGFNVDGFHDFGEWVRATGQETLGGRIVGKYQDPKLRKNGAGLLTGPANLQNLEEYRLLSESPAIDAGLNLKAEFGIDPAGTDYYGAPVPAGKGCDIGAHEFRGQPSTHLEKPAGTEEIPSASNNGH